MKRTTVKPRLAVRLAGLLPVAAGCTAAAILYVTSFEATITDVLNILIVLLVPWSAINLSDFYIVRKGRYTTEALFDPTGIYGIANRAGLISFALGVLAAVPLANFGFWVAPGARALGGGDLSWAARIVVGGGCYLIATSKIWRTHPPSPRASERVRISEPTQPDGTSRLDFGE